MIEGFFAKFSESSRSKLAHFYGVIWEADDDIEHCRYCRAEFSLMWRKHHCRLCGGIYCGDCSFGQKRTCIFCLRGLSPSAYLLATYKSVSQMRATQSHESSLYLPQPQIVFGSLYDNNFVRPKDEIAHKSGYFQFTNRSETKCCAVKIVSHGCNVYQEVFRPPYMTVPPRESIYSIITNLPYIYILVLYDNPFVAEEGMTLTYTSMRADDVTPCASIKNFRKFSIYRSYCRGKNVLLKFNDTNKVDLRVGQGRRLKYQAVGLLSTVFSKGNTVVEDNSAATLDFTTNIDDLDEVMFL
jgi:hypothetical protein